MSRLNSIFMMGGAGYGGAYFYNNRDLLDEVLGDRVRGLQHSLLPSRGVSSDAASIAALEGLSREIAELKQAQRAGHHSLIISSQPTTILGVPMWKAVGLVGTLGFIYFKVKGYEMRDLVYVSQKHFTTVAESLRQQFDVMQTVLGAVKADLMERVHVVETKLVETREAIEALIGFRIGKVEERVDGLSTELTNTNAQISENTIRLGQISGDLVDVKSNISAVGVELDGRISQVQTKVGELRESTNENFERMNEETHNLDLKIERLSDQTSSQLVSIQSGIEESQKGISLLVEFVSAQSKEVSGVDSEMTNNLQNYVQSRPFRYAPFAGFHRRSVSASASLPSVTPVSGF
eukprot:c3817_g1_i1.p1 GENE.c3817_g1_i1~~c3817_g1_i1.p1  ORF type:complete len:350 (-),score=135.33 c3817_g1_i1:43-1092(-)